MRTLSKTLYCTVLIGLLTTSTVWADPPSDVIDLAEVEEDDDLLTRVYGADGEGFLGLPVAGGPDIDGDGFADYAVSFFQADPFARSNAGEVNVIFGDGTLGARIDSALFDPRILRLVGEQVGETAGSEIWIDDLTGDGLAEILICRQNFTPDAERIGAGALSIIFGSPTLRQKAADPEPLDLGDLPEDVEMLTLVGAAASDRLGIWVRTGDIDGDGVTDLLVGADQVSNAEENHRGAAYVLRGGALNGGVIDLADDALGGDLARIDPPSGASEFHFGATTQLADLDGNGRAEVLVAATLLRGGAFLAPPGAPPGSTHSAGGTDQGTVYIVWDDNFPSGAWPDGFVIDLDDPPGTVSVLDGGPGNERFGEELLGGLDFDGNGKADLFVGDIFGDPSGGINGDGSGSGHVFYDAASLKGRVVDLDDLPADVRITTILGPIPGALGGDTAAQGDFNADGLADLAFSAPHGNPQDRANAGQFFIAYGREGGWPGLIDTRDGEFPSPEAVRILEIQGAEGTRGFSVGDTLGYSAAAGDIDGDGRTDLITNEMVGDGLAPNTIDVGNLVVLSGAQLSGQGPQEPLCVPAPAVHCFRNQRFKAEVVWRNFEDVSDSGRVVPGASDDSGLFWFFSADNWEMLVKVIDGCDFNDRYWVFAAAITNVEYTLTVTDTVTGVERQYSNELGMSSRAVTDTEGFMTCP